MKIKITCEGQKMIPIGDLIDFQGSLKTLDNENYEKCKQSIIEYGFSFPVFIWERLILDGHQRVYTCKKMIDSGYEIEGDIPCVEIHAKDKKEAATKLLLINSTYGKMEQDNFRFFTEKHKINIGNIVNKIALKDISCFIKPVDIPGLVNRNYDNNEQLEPEGYTIESNDSPASSIDDKEAPEEFKEYDEDIETAYCCPKCNYAWSGKPK